MAKLFTFEEGQIKNTHPPPPDLARFEAGVGLQSN